MDEASQRETSTATEPPVEPRRSPEKPPSAIDRLPIQRLIIGCSGIIALWAAASWWFAAAPHPSEVPERLFIVDINKASEAELCLLPGIGPVAAEDIVAEREAGGPYASLDQVAQRVRGIGPKTIAACRPHVDSP
ncbi:ComEA family DNA-binding protein [Roseimaritima ulvae]|uniref:Helix-hairpin-helix motif protein n=1 Tax=Roseimaritima ulvae TaxID=980254 RepID=A0A5B9QXM2_9BACT|nr:helix-hairpin-helix domain-containing protein [Roseimaritima ulvae]QEG42560.1 Helix-hairpin-helix motif protein [Roseimaritima ulvae]